MRAKPPTRSSRPVRSAKVSGKTPPSSEKKNQSTEVQKISDISVLRTSIDTSVSGLGQVIKLFDTGTPEVCDMLSNECSVIYECKVCRNLFRSVANFLSHKRTYCTLKHTEASKTGKGDQVVEHTLLLGNGKGNTLSSRTTSRKDIISLLDNLVVGEPHDERNLNHTRNTVILKEMNSTSAGLFNFNKENLEGNSGERGAVTLGPDGKVAGHESHGGSDKTKCTICHHEFANQKTLAVHLRTAHGNYRICFICPCCKKYFSNTWSVYRHLFKVHRKSNEQVRRLRPQIQKKQVSIDEMIRTNNPLRPPVEEKPYDQDRAWMEELEGNMELQRCLGCGKRFERRVALLSHSQTCQKRMAVKHKLPKRRPPSPPKPADKRSRIQVRMFYEKVNQPKPPEVVTSPPPTVLSSPLIVASPQAVVENQNSPASPHISDKDVNDVVSRYRKDMDVHDKCCRLEAKLLQLHKVAVEEVEGALNEGLVSVSETSIRECIGTVSTKTPPLTSSSTEASIEVNTDVQTSLETDNLDLKIENKNDIISTEDPDIIVIEDDEDDYIIPPKIPKNYINGDVLDKNFQSVTEESDIANDISLQHIEMRSRSESAIDFSHDSDSSVGLNQKSSLHLNGGIHSSENSICSPSPIQPVNGDLKEDSDPETEERTKCSPSWWMLTKVNSFVNKAKKKCLICQKTYKRAIFVTRHVAAVHLNIYKFKCKVDSCDFKCFLRGDLNNHLLKIHKKKEPLSFFERIYPNQSEIDTLMAFKLPIESDQNGVCKEQDVNIYEETVVDGTNAEALSSLESISSVNDTTCSGNNTSAEGTFDFDNNERTEDEMPECSSGNEGEGLEQQIEICSADIVYFDSRPEMQEDEEYLSVQDFENFERLVSESENEANCDEIIDGYTISTPGEVVVTDQSLEPEEKFQSGDEEQDSVVLCSESVDCNEKETVILDVPESEDNSLEKENVDTVVEEKQGSLGICLPEERREDETEDIQECIQEQSLVGIDVVEEIEEDEFLGAPEIQSDDKLKARMMEMIFGTNKPQMNGDVVLSSIHEELVDQDSSDWEQ